MVPLPCKTSSNILHIFWGFEHVASVGKVPAVAIEPIQASGHYFRSGRQTYRLRRGAPQNSTVKTPQRRDAMSGKPVEWYPGSDSTKG